MRQKRGAKRVIGKRGFTLVEMIVVIAISLIITSFTVANQRQFQSQTTLSNLAQDVALSVRLTQTYGLTVRDGSSDEFQISYGIRFSDATPTEYFIFKDPNRGVGGFTHTSALNIVETTQVNAGYSILNVCLDRRATAPLVQDCFSGGDNDIAWVDIVFDRPKPDAHFSTNLDSSDTLYDRALITIQSPDQEVATVEVLLTGFISTN